MTDAHVRSKVRRRDRLHPLAIRVMHWINAAAMVILIGSGWAIYNDEVIFGWLHFPGWITLGAGPEGALQWHFLAMWLLAANGVAYLVYGLATGRFRRMLLPIRFAEVVAEMRAALALRLSHDDLTRYNAVQRALYIGIIAVGIVQVLTGLAIWKPVQLSELAALFYDFQTARLVHFLGMAAIVAFVVVHVALALVVPRTLLAMLTGGPVVARDAPADWEEPPIDPPVASEPPDEPPIAAASPVDPPGRESPLGPVTDAEPKPGRPEVPAL
jgi:thiosulfate reductase cytochrome b subunit